MLQGNSTKDAVLDGPAKVERDCADMSFFCDIPGEDTAIVSTSSSSEIEMNSCGRLCVGGRDMDSRRGVSVTFPFPRPLVLPPLPLPLLLPVLDSGFARNSSRSDSESVSVPNWADRLAVAVCAARRVLRGAVDISLG